MSVSNMPPIDRAEQSTAHEIQQAKVIDLNDRVLNLDNPDDKMISAFANYAVQTENWQQNALQALRSDKEGLTPESCRIMCLIIMSRFHWWNISKKDCRCS